MAVDNASENLSPPSNQSKACNCCPASGRGVSSGRSGRWSSPAVICIQIAILGKGSLISLAVKRFEQQQRTAPHRTRLLGNVMSLKCPKVVPDPQLHSRRMLNANKSFQPDIHSLSQTQTESHSKYLV